MTKFNQWERRSAGCGYGGQEGRGLEPTLGRSAQLNCIVVLGKYVSRHHGPVFENVVPRRTYLAYARSVDRVLDDADLLYSPQDSKHTAAFERCESHL